MTTRTIKLIKTFFMFISCFHLKIDNLVSSFLSVFDSELRGPDVALATRGLVTNPESAATYDEHAKSGAEKAAEELNVLSARRVADLATTSLQQDIDYLNKMDALIYALHCNICGTDKAQTTRKSIAPSLMIPTALAPPSATPLTTQKAVSQPTAEDPAIKKEK